MNTNYINSIATYFLFRNYALRRIRDGFKSNKQIGDPEKMLEQQVFAKQNLDIIRRQVKYIL